MKKSNLKTTCFSTSIFLRFWLHFGCFGKALGPLLGGFGRLKWRPRGWGTLNQAYFCFNFFHFRGCTFNFLRFGRVWGRFWEGSGKVWDGFGEVWGRILDRFEDLGRGFSTTRPLRFCVPRRLGFWGCEQEIAATKTIKTIFCPCSPQRPQQQNVDLLVFVAALSLWLSFPGSLNTNYQKTRHKNK